MSRGPGHVQSTIRAAFEAHPDRSFSAVQLATLIYGKAGRSQCKAVRRAADPVAAALGWMRRKIEGRVDYVRRETVSRECHRRADRAKELLA